MSQTQTSLQQTQLPTWRHWTWFKRHSSPPSQAKLSRSYPSTWMEKRFQPSQTLDPMLRLRNHSRSLKGKVVGRTNILMPWPWTRRRNPHKSIGQVKFNFVILFVRNNKFSIISFDVKNENSLVSICIIIFYYMYFIYFVYKISNAMYALMIKSF